MSFLILSFVTKVWFSFSIKVRNWSVGIAKIFFLKEVEENEQERKDKKTMEIKIKSIDTIRESAREFIENIGESKVFAFYGKMGAGKTTFV